MSNIVVVIQGGVEVLARESIVVSVSSTGEKYREHKVRFEGDTFVVLNSGDSNYLPIAWQFTESPGMKRFSVQHTYNSADIEVFRVQETSYLEPIEVTLEPDVIYIDKIGFNEFFDNTEFMIRVPKTVPGQFQ